MCGRRRRSLRRRRRLRHQRARRRRRVGARRRRRHRRALGLDRRDLIAEFPPRRSPPALRLEPVVHLVERGPLAAHLVRPPGRPHRDARLRLRPLQLARVERSRRVRAADAVGEELQRRADGLAPLLAPLPHRAAAASNTPARLRSSKPRCEPFARWRPPRPALGGAHLAEPLVAQRFALHAEFVFDLLLGEVRRHRVSVQRAQFSLRALRPVGSPRFAARVVHAHTLSSDVTPFERALPLQQI